MRCAAVLFPPPVLDYSAAQDDLCMAAIYAAAACILRTFPRQAVILDGRSFSRAYQVRDLLALAASLNEPAHIIECVCDDAVCGSGWKRDLRAANIRPGIALMRLYLERKAAAEPIAVPHLVLDTGGTPLDECVKQLSGIPERRLKGDGPCAASAVVRAPWAFSSVA